MLDLKVMCRDRKLKVAAKDRKPEVVQKLMDFLADPLHGAWQQDSAPPVGPPGLVAGVAAPVSSSGAMPAAPKENRRTCTNGRCSIRVSAS